MAITSTFSQQIKWHSNINQLAKKEFKFKFSIPVVITLLYVCILTIRTFLATALAQWKRIGIRIQRLRVQVPWVVEFFYTISHHLMRLPLSSKKTSLLRERLSRNVQFQYQNEIMGLVASRIAGSNLHFHPKSVINPISSATLFCSMIKNYAIRNNHFSNNHMKRIEGILHPKNKIWNTNHWPEPRRTAVFDTLEEIRTRLKLDLVKRNYLKKTLNLFPSSDSLQALYRSADFHSRTQYSKQMSLLNILQAMQFKTDVVCSSIFPRTASSADLLRENASSSASSSFLNDTIQRSNAQVSHLCNGLMSGEFGDESTNAGNSGSGRSLLGVSVKLKGVRIGGALSSTFQKSVGRTSINSVFGRKGKGGLVFEKASCQIRTNQGIVGLKLTVVYAKQSDLLSPKYELPSFLKPMDSLLHRNTAKNTPVFGFEIANINAGQTNAKKIAMDHELSAVLSSYVKPSSGQVE